MPVDLVDDPIGDPRWADLVDRHPDATIFHTPGWLDALRRTYGYQPFVVTTSPGAALRNGLVVCRVKSWASRRLVSLPFSDHCQPLVEGTGDLEAMLTTLLADARDGGWRSVEVRPRSTTAPADALLRGAGLGPSREYCLHTLDLRPDRSDLFRRFHPSHMQRAIRRAEREGLTCETGQSDALLASFYRLLRITRRRHGLPPQPFAWFRHLVACLGDRVAIYVASKDGQPVASVLTLSFKQTVVYKYGGSDAAQHHLGGMPFLFWRVIQEAGARGCVALDLGRSDLDQPGLMAFKDHLGASRSSLIYYRHPDGPREAARRSWIGRAARHVLPLLPDSALDLAGRLLYRHLG